MPLYDIRCDRTGAKFERVIKLANYAEPVICACGSVAKRLISTPMFSVDNTGYNCPVTGDWVGSKRQHEENLRKQGCRVFEAGEKELAAKRRKADDDKLDRMIEDTVEKEFESYPSAKKEQLHNELVNGKLDLSVDRK